MTSTISPMLQVLTEWGPWFLVVDLVLVIIFIIIYLKFEKIEKILKKYHFAK